MITFSAIVQRLNRLQGRDLVTRAPNADDARSTDVTLTDKGHEVISAALPDHVFNEHRLLAALTQAERDRLAELLEALSAALATRSAADGG